MTENLGEVTKEMWQLYEDLNTTSLIYYALLGIPSYTPLRILGYGMQGSGKTTFLYYSAKVAFTRYLCHKDKVRKEECLEHAVKTYDLCLGRDCPRDKVDDELMRGFYITVDDLLRRFLRDVRTKEIADRHIIFFDDAFTPKLWWSLGGEWRELYYVAKTFDQFYRDNINVLILTAPNIYYFTRDYIKNSLMLEFSTFVKDGVAFTKAVHYIYPHFTKYYFGDSYLFKAKKIDFTDSVPFRRAFGIPKWLEELNTERRQYVLRETAEHAMKAIMRMMKKKKEVAKA